MMKIIKENSLGEVYIQKINHGNKTKAKNKAKEVAKQFEEELNTPREERKNVNSSSELIEVDPTSDMLYGDYLLKKWLPFVKNSLEVTSYSGYENKTKIIAKYFNNLGITLNNLTKSDIKKFYTYLQETRHIKNKTVNRYHANIHKSLEDAITEFELIEVNPAHGLRKKEQSYIPTYYKQKDLELLFEKVKGELIELHVLLASYYGFRREEVCRFKMDSNRF